LTTNIEKGDRINIVDVNATPDDCTQVVDIIAFTADATGESAEILQLTTSV